MGGGGGSGDGGGQTPVPPPRNMPRQLAGVRGLLSQRGHLVSEYCLLIMHRSLCLYFMLTYTHIQCIMPCIHTLRSFIIFVLILCLIPSAYIVFILLCTHAMSFYHSRFIILCTCTVSVVLYCSSLYSYYSLYSYSIIL